MIKYIIGFILNIMNPAVSCFTKIDNLSKVDRKAKVYRKTTIFNSKINKYSYIAKGSSIVYTEIGKFCSIGSGSSIGMGHHTLDKLSTSPIFTEKKNGTGHSWTNKSKEYPYKKIIIQNDVWIGSRVIIIGGINIGNGAVIAAGSIVTKDVPPYAIVAGIPAKIIKYRFNEDIIQYLQKIEWWNYSEYCLKSQLQLFQNSDMKEVIIKLEYLLKQSIDDTSK